MKTTLVMLATVAALFGAASAANAGTITIYSGSDDGAPLTGPFPNSAAAQASFLAAAGPTTTVTFESNALGYYSPVSVTGASIALTGPDDGDSFSGISADTNGSVYGFNTTSGGANWLGFPDGTATFTFASPVDAFGAYFTGLQTVFTTNIDVTFTDGTSEDLTSVPINVNGGASYWGFTDSASFSSLTISDISNDAWGIDDVSFAAPSVAPVPEPITLSLFGAGLAGAAAMRRRKKANGA